MHCLRLADATGAEAKARLDSPSRAHPDNRTISRGVRARWRATVDPSGALPDARQGLGPAAAREIACLEGEN